MEGPKLRKKENGSTGVPSQKTHAPVENGKIKKIASNKSQSAF